MDEIERLNKEKYFGGLYNIEEEHKIMQASAKESGYRDGLKAGHDLGLQEGHDIGVEENKNEIAINLLKNNVDIHVIAN